MIMDFFGFPADVHLKIYSELFGLWPSMAAVISSNQKRRYLSSTPPCRQKAAQRGRRATLCQGPFPIPAHFHFLTIRHGECSIVTLAYGPYRHHTEATRRGQPLARWWVQLGLTQAEMSYGWIPKHRLYAQSIGIQGKAVTQVALHLYDHQQETLLNETNLVLRVPLRGSDTTSAEVQFLSQSRHLHVFSGL